MDELLKHALLDLLKHNPAPYVLMMAVLAVGAVVLIRGGLEDHSVPVGGKIAAVVVGLALLGIGGAWAKSEAKDYCATLRGTLSWDTQHCSEIDPEGSGGLKLQPPP